MLQLALLRVILSLFAGPPAILEAGDSLNTKTEGCKTGPWEGETT